MRREARICGAALVRKPVPLHRRRRGAVRPHDHPNSAYDIVQSRGVGKLAAASDALNVDVNQLHIELDPATCSGAAFLVF